MTDAGPNRIDRLSAHTAVTRVGGAAFALVSSVVLARALGPALRGTYQLVVTIAAIATTASLLGMTQAQFRLWADGATPVSVLVPTTRRVSGLLSVVGGSIALVVGLAAVDLDAGTASIGVVVGLMFASVIVQTQATLDGGLLSLAGQMRVGNRATFIAGAVQLLGFASLWLAGWLTVTRAVAVYVAALASTLLAQRARLNRVLPRPTARMNADVARDLLRKGITVYPYLLLAFLNLRIDVLFLARSGSHADIGLYAVAVQLAEVLWLVTDAVSLALVERQANATEDEALRVSGVAVRLNVIIACAAAGVVALLCPVLLRVAYGESFAAATTATRWLLVASIAAALWRPITGSMLRVAPMWVLGATSAMAAVVNVIGNAVLVPRLGIEGAAIASVLSYSVFAVIALSWLHRRAQTPWSALVPRRSDFDRIRGLLRGR